MPASLTRAAPLSALLLVACGAADGGGECRQDSDCAPMQGCIAKTCVARMPAEAARWALEASPGSQSPFATMEHADVSFGPATTTIAVDRKTPVMLALSSGESSYVASDSSTSVHAVVSVPSLIPKRGSLSFESDGSNTTALSPYSVTLTVPARFVGMTSRLRVLPNPPLNRTMPPWELEVTLAPVVQSALPPVGEVVTFEGRLEPADPMATLQATYVARARLGNRIVSNSCPTDERGRFVLRIQKSVAGPSLEGVSVEVAPADTARALPTLVIPRLDPAHTNLGTLRMPAFQSPEVVKVPVVDRDKRQPVAGATVRFAAPLDGASGAEAMYVRVAQTGADGQVSVPLIPGMGTKARIYTVSVTPPKNAEVAAHCEERYGISAAVGAGAVGASIELPRKVVLAGVVTSAAGAAARDMRVRATREGDVFEARCGGDLVSPPSETTTDAMGRFKLDLDPGTYTIEYETTAGGALPTVREEGVKVPESTNRAVTLPEGALAEGRLVSPDGAPIPNGEVRVFDLSPSGQAYVRGVALSGSDGRFRLVLPRR